MRFIPQLFLLLLLLVPLLGSAQVLHQYGYWGRFFLRTQLAPRVSLASEFDERRLAFPDKQWQFIMHHHVHYRASEIWDAGLGGTLSWQPQNDVVVPERRIFEEITATVPLGAKRLRLQPRLRVEQRWLRQLAGTDLADNWAYRARFRGRLQLEYALGPTWKLRASEELMLNASSFDQNRIYLGAERRLGAGWGVELGYLHLRQKRTTTPGFYSRDVLRLAVLKDWAPWQKTTK